MHTMVFARFSHDRRLVTSAEHRETEYTLRTLDSVRCFVLWVGETNGEGSRRLPRTFRPGVEFQVLRSIFGK
jgi:hypothetical protein